MAVRYRQILDDLGVEISVSKSLVSYSGAAEFAKRFLVRGLTVDLSPVSVRSLLSCHHPYGLVAIAHLYPFKRFSTLARVGGIHPRQLSRLDHKRSRHFERVFVMKQAFTLPLSLWLGGGLPLNPYLEGFLIS